MVENCHCHLKIKHSQLFVGVTGRAQMKEEWMSEFITLKKRLPPKNTKSRSWRQPLSLKQSEQINSK